MNAPPQQDGLIEFDNEPPKAELKLWCISLFRKIAVFCRLISYFYLKKAQSPSELKSMAANKSLCPKMFDQWSIERSTVGVKDSFWKSLPTYRYTYSGIADCKNWWKCEQRTQLNTFCRAFCLNKSHVFVPGSVQTAQCRGRHIRFPVMPKGHAPFARCGDPEKVQG